MVADLLAIDRGQETNLAIVDPEHRHGRARVRSKGAEDRAVAADREADVDVEPDGRVEFELGSGTQGVLSGLLGVETQDGAGLARDPAQLFERRRSLGRPAVGHHSGGADRLHGSTARALLSRSSTPPRGPSASHMNVSRFPLGPGRPELA